MGQACPPKTVYKVRSLGGEVHCGCPRPGGGSSDGGGAVSHPRASAVACPGRRGLPDPRCNHPPAPCHSAMHHLFFQSLFPEKTQFRRVSRGVSPINTDYWGVMEIFTP